MSNSKITNNLEYLGLLRVSGEGAKKLLQGQISCNLDEISLTKSSLAVHCNPQGRIISLFRIFQLGTDYYLQMPRDLIPIAQAALNKYAPFFKVTLSDVSKAFSQIGYSGPALQNMPEDIAVLNLNEELSRYEIIGESNSVNKFISTMQTPPEMMTTDDWKKLSISAGIPSVYAATSEKFLPHELNLHKLDAISFTKGCYTGQEIIARMQYRGKLKNHLYSAQTQSISPPSLGDEIYNQIGACGTIVDFISIDNKNYNLLVIAPEAEVNSVPLFLNQDKNNVLEFLTLPYTI